VELAQPSVGAGAHEDPDGALPVVAQRRDAVGAYGVVGEHHAALPRGHHLAGVEGVRPHVAEHPAGNAMERRPDGARGVLDEVDVGSEGAQRRDLRGHAELVDGDDRAGARREGAGDLRGGEVPGGGVDVDEDGVGVAEEHGVARGGPGHRGDDHLVARAHALGVVARHSSRAVVPLETASADGTSWAPGASGRLFWGVRSHNYHGVYALSIGLWVEGRHFFDPQGTTDIAAGIDVDLQVLAIPFVALYVELFRRTRSN
jgi:hypothetical protein